VGPVVAKASGKQLNTGCAKAAICKQIGGGHDFTYCLFVR